MKKLHRAPSVLALALLACASAAASPGNAADAAPAGRPLAQAVRSPEPLRPGGEYDQVLSLDEAAALLRSPAAEIARLAAAGELPGRLIGSQWRFSRRALLAWLDQPGAPGATAASVTRAANRPPPADPLPDQLATVRGRGIDGATTPPVVGEQPVAASAEAVALRDQGVLLKGGRGSIEFGASYGRSESVIPGLTRIEASQASATLTGRYGLVDNLQIVAALPYQYSRNAVHAGGGTSTVSDQSMTGDASLALYGVAVSESARHPALILNLQAIAPTGPGDAAVGGGFSLTRNYDPLVLFGGLSYLYGIDIDVNDPDRQLARHNLSFNLGYAYSLNETIALSAQFAGSYRIHATPASASVVKPARERYQLQFGVTYLMSPSWYVEPTIAFGLSSGAPDFTFGLAIPYSF